MSHVSGQLTAQLLECVERTDWPFEVDLSGLDLEVLRDPSGWAPWEQYTGLLLGIIGGGCDGERLRESAIRHADYGARGTFRHVGAIAGGLRPLYRATFGWIMTSMMKCVDASVVDSGPSRLRLEVSLDPSFPESPAFFLTLAGTAIALPRNLGMSDASLVQVETGTHHGVYEVLLPPSTSVWARSRRAWSAFFDSRGFEVAAKGFQDSIDGLLGDLKEANAQLATSEAQLRTLTDSLPGVVLVIGASGEPVRVLGGSVPPAGVVREIVAAFRIPERLDRVLDGGGALSFDVEDEEGRWTWACRAIRLPGSEHAVVVGLDDTEPTLTRRALLEARKMEALGRVSGGIAHDFNNVLTAVRGNAELLALARPDDPQVQEHAGAIRDAVKRATGLTQQLLTYARREEVATEILDPSRVVQETEGMLSSLVGDAVVLELDCPGGLAIEADESRLQQVLLNLVVNARDALPAGGRIGIALAARGADVVLEVSDDGEGMPPEVRARALDPFFTTKEVGRGTGLGLSTVYGIVEQWGGEMDLESALGEGTTVRIVLPRREGSEVRPVDDEEPGSPVGGDETILLVEDDGDVREVVQLLLESRGYRVIQSEHAAAALSAVEELGRPPDLLLTDLTMPGRSGVELAGELAERFPELRVLVMSGYVEAGEDPSAQLPCPSAFLAKPFRLAELGRVVRALLDDVPARGATS